jgi:hypothetical protein
VPVKIIVSNRIENINFPLCPVAFIEKAKVYLKRKGFLKKQRFIAQAKVYLN